jgi:hypothetical protein
MVISARMVPDHSGEMQAVLASMSTDDALEYAIGQPHARIERLPQRTSGRDGQDHLTTTL